MTNIRVTEEERIKTRRGQILAAAADLFSEKGFHSTTTKEIAARAEVAEGTLYNYFKDKRDILMGIAEESAYPEAPLLNTAKLDSRDALVAIFEKAIEITVAERPFVQTVMGAAYMDDELGQEFITVRVKKAQDHLQKLLSQGIANHILRPMNIEMTARLISSILMGFRLPGALPRVLSPERRHALAQAAVDLILDGIRIHHPIQEGNL